MSTTEATVDVIRTMAGAIEEHRQYLTQLDAAIGDADHGTNMHRGFQAALKQLDAAEAKSPSDVLKTVAMALIGKVGGAAGPLYGTAFLRASTALAGREEGTGMDTAEAIDAALEGVKQRGKAEVGDKTIVDALEPAVRAAREAAAAGAAPAKVLRVAAEAAREGAESTEALLARKGRASYLGERSVGHKDPGATSTYLLLDAAAKALGA